MSKIVLQPIVLTGDGESYRISNLKQTVTIDEAEFLKTYSDYPTAVMLKDSGPTTSYGVSKRYIIIKGEQ